MSRPIPIAIALVALTAILVLHYSTTEQEEPAATVAPTAAGTASPPVETSGLSSTPVEARDASHLPPASSGEYPPDIYGVTRQHSVAPVQSIAQEISANAAGHERGLDPAVVAADMSGGQPGAAVRQPPSGGPSIHDSGLSGPNRIQAASAAGIVEPEISQAAETPDLPESLGPGPSQTDLGLPGPGEE